MSPEWITAGCALLALFGGGTWASVQFFATKDQTKALFDLIAKLQGEVNEIKIISQTAISNQEYYKMRMEDQNKLIERNDTLLRNMEPLMLKIAGKV